jgi:hypothetical protein
MRIRPFRTASGFGQLFLVYRKERIFPYGTGVRHELFDFEYAVGILADVGALISLVGIPVEGKIKRIDDQRIGIGKPVFQIAQADFPVFFVQQVLRTARFEARAA